MATDPGRSLVSSSAAGCGDITTRSSRKSFPGSTLARAPRQSDIRVPEAAISGQRPALHIFMSGEIYVERPIFVLSVAIQLWDGYNFSP